MYAWPCQCCQCLDELVSIRIQVTRGPESGVTCGRRGGATLKGDVRCGRTVSGGGREERPCTNKHTDHDGDDERVSACVYMCVS